MSRDFRDLHAEHLAPPDAGDWVELEASIDPDEVLAEVEGELLRHIDPDDHPLMPYLRWRLGLPTHLPTSAKPVTHRLCLVCQQALPHDLSHLPTPVPACVVGELQATIHALQGEILRLKAAHPMIGLIERAIDRVVERTLAREE
ncbi:MAG TPA: hypothetical protein VNP04_21570 [Alphaproteobacteria bacterium]|nr:hypothetical protein [Alphaproteobacteria bacterium]